MNKKGQFIAILSLFFILGLVAINYYLVQGTGTIIQLYNTPVSILNQDSEINEYLLDLNQNVKYSSFKAFDDLCENSGFYGYVGLDVTGSVVQERVKCETWKGECNPVFNLKENFEDYFKNYFLGADDFDININIKNNKFVISGKYKEGEKSFESFNIKTKVPVEFSYILDYDVSVFEDLYKNCMVLGCDELDDTCVVPKNKCSSDQNFIYMEYNYKKDNGFIQPKIKFKLSKPKEIF